MQSNNITSSVVHCCFGMAELIDGFVVGMVVVVVLVVVVLMAINGGLGILWMGLW